MSLEEQRPPYEPPLSDFEPKAADPAPWLQDAQEMVNLPSALIIPFWSVMLFAMVFGVVDESLDCWADTQIASRTPSPNLLLWFLMGTGYAALGLFCSILYVRLRSYYWALAACVLLQINVLGCFVAQGLGIWAMIVLRRPQVRQAIRYRQSQRRANNQVFQDYQEEKIDRPNSQIDV